MRWTTEVVDYSIRLTQITLRLGVANHTHPMKHRCTVSMAGTQPLLTLSLLIAFLVVFGWIVQVHASQAGGSEAKSDVNVVGQWVAEPALGQLGMTQTRVSFEEGGAYTQKQDMISFCDGRDRGIDCEYVWMINEGDYSVEGNVVTINIKKDRKIVLLTGQAEPDITENSEYPRSHKILIERQGNSLLTRKSLHDVATVFKRED